MEGGINHSEIRSKYTIRIRHKCYPYSLSKFFKNLNPKQRASLEATAFGPLLSLPELKVSVDLMHQLLQRWSVEKKAFKIGSHYVEFSLRDIAFILGLRVVDIEDNNTRNNSKKYDILKRFFGKKTVIKKNDVELALKKCSNDDHLEEYTRITLVYIMIILLFPSGNSNICPKFVFVEDLSKFNRMAWGKLVHEFLVESLCTSAKKLARYSKLEVGVKFSRELRAKRAVTRGNTLRKSVSMNGCAIALQIWAFEHIPLLQPQSFITNFPRIHKYKAIYHSGEDLSDNKKEFVARTFQALECNHVTKVLCPTPVELNEAVIKEVLDINVDGTNSISTTKYRTYSGFVCMRSDFLVNCNIVCCTESKVKSMEEKINIELVDGRLEKKVFDVQMLPDFRLEEAVQGQLLTLNEECFKSIEKEAYGQLKDVKKDWTNLEVPLHSPEDMTQEDLTTPHRKYVKVNCSLKQNGFIKNLKRKWPVHENCGSEFVSDFHKQKRTNEKHQWPNEKIDMIEMIEDGHDRSTSVKDEKVRSLGGYKWLTSDFMEEYIEILRRRHYSLHRDQNHLRCIFLSVYFMQMVKLRLDGARAHLETKNIGYSFENCDKIFIPGHWDGNHWVLYVLNIREKKLEFFNSLNTTHHCNNDINDLVIFFEENFNFSMSDWPHQHFIDVPQQENGHDCGIFVLKYIEYLSQGETLSFSQRDMPRFRKTLIADIQASKKLDCK